MVRLIIKRPVGVIAVFLSLIFTGIFFIKKVPVSLLPNIDVPQIVIRVTYANTSSEKLENTIIRPIRESLTSLKNLKDITSTSSNHTGTISLHFEYGTQMELSFIEVNEKVDRLMGAFPKDMVRPQITRVNTTDIPVIRVQVIPKRSINYLEVSRLSEKILRKRLEQIDGVSIVDINGVRNSVICVTPKSEQIKALNIDEELIGETINNTNSDLGGMSIKDGNYRYFVKVSTELVDESKILKLPIKLKDGTIISLAEIADISVCEENQLGYHLFNGREGLVLTIQKQARSRMNELVPEILRTIEKFRIDYPEIDFEVSQDQTFLLDAGIDNLTQDIIYAGIFTIILLFMFLGNWQAPLLMSITIPVSLTITFIFFYIFKLSFNIISLSGLALGIGMLIDTSIVVVDSITRSGKTESNPVDAAVKGTNKVIVPVISQVLTTVVVYAPLILVGGMAGELIFDQSIGLTISLLVALLSAFILTPLLYSQFAKKKTVKEDTIIYMWVAGLYHKMIDKILKYKPFFLVVTFCIMIVGFWILTRIPVTALPQIEKKESQILINWNAPIDAKENLRRSQDLDLLINDDCIVTEWDIGIKQYLFNLSGDDIQQSSLYFLCANEGKKIKVDDMVKAWIRKNYPYASISITDAPNAFTQLFVSTSPYIEFRFMDPKGVPDYNWDSLLKLLNGSVKHDYKLGLGLIKEPTVMLKLDYKKMSLVGVDREDIEVTLQKQFSDYTIAEMKQLDNSKPVRLATKDSTFYNKLFASVRTKSGAYYPLNYFVTFENDSDFRTITADRTGAYKSIYLDDQYHDWKGLQQVAQNWAKENKIVIKETGKYYDDKNLLNGLLKIFFMVLILLYLILVIQYENLILPLLVMATIPLGVFGSVLLLWIFGGTLDVMAGIGFVVVIGLIVDDPILKIETLIRLEKEYAGAGLPRDEKLLKRMIHEAGEICLKPLLMVSLTTSIAMLPVLFIGGIGNDLQKPLAIVIIGGLTLGTFFTTWFIPLTYWYVSKYLSK